MREVWCIAAILASIGAVFTDDERIRVVATVVAVLFWVTFGITERYGRLNTTQAQKDA